MLIVSLIVLQLANILADNVKRFQDCQVADAEGTQEGECVPGPNASITRNIGPGETGCFSTSLNYGSVIMAKIDSPHSVSTDLSLTGTLGSDRRPGRSQFHYYRDDVIGTQIPAIGTIRWTICASNGGNDVVAFVAKNIAMFPGFYYFVYVLAEAGRDQVRRVREGGDPALMIPRLPFFP